MVWGKWRCGVAVLSNNMPHSEMIGFGCVNSRILVILEFQEKMIMKEELISVLKVEGPNTRVW